MRYMLNCWFPFLILCVVGSHLFLASAFGETGTSPRCALGPRSRESDPCSEEDVKAADAELLRTYQSAVRSISEIPGLPTEDQKAWKLALRNSERAWILFRDKDCQTLVPYEPSALSGVTSTINSCRVQLTHSRNRMLLERYTLTSADQSSEGVAQKDTPKGEGVEITSPSQASVTAPSESCEQIIASGRFLTPADIAEVVIHTAGDTAKGEFESSAAYRQRAAAISARIKDEIRDVAGSPFVTFTKAVDPANTHYDADRRTLTFDFPSGYVQESSETGTTEQSVELSDVGGGRQRTVLGVALTPPQTNESRPSVTLNLSANDARSFKENGLLVVVAAVTPPFVIRHHDVPYYPTVNYIDLVASPVCFALTDPKTHRVVLLGWS